jgi:D-alanyl-D-alanine carboxypeptidase (penicillin-binding protein 5/6)
MLKNKFFLGSIILLISINTNATISTIPIDPLSKINSRSYILVDQETGQVLKSLKSTEKLAPASLTKVMTAYVVFDKLKNGNLKLDDETIVSKKAWKTGGSKTFIEVGTKVKIEDLIKGMIVQSGNDAATALAEHISGTEEDFAVEMNNYAKKIGMENSNFLNVSGLPTEGHYSTAEDLGLLGRKMILDFPEYYPYYSIKNFTYNNISQNSRNRLLASDSEVDGMKTGYTDKAGYCYISSAVRNGKRLVTVVLGADKPQKRFDDAKILFNYGFNNFDTHKVVVKNKVIEQLNTGVLKGAKNLVRVGAAEDIVFVSEKNKKEDIDVEVNMRNVVIAPIAKGDVLGIMIIKRNQEIIAEVDVIALEGINTGDFFKVLKDSLQLYLENFN